MANFRHRMFISEFGSEPKLRVRFKAKEKKEYVITGEDVKNWCGYPLGTVAYKFFNDSSLWWIIADTNRTRAPWSYQEGDVIFIPLDWADALEFQNDIIDDELKDALRRPEL